MRLKFGYLFTLDFRVSLNKINYYLSENPVQSNLQKKKKLEEAYFTLDIQFLINETP